MARLEGMQGPGHGRHLGHRRFDRRAIPIRGGRGRLHRPRRDSRTRGGGATGRGVRPRRRTRQRRRGSLGCRCGATGSGDSTRSSPTRECSTRPSCRRRRDEDWDAVLETNVRRLLPLRRRLPAPSPCGGRWLDHDDLLRRRCLGRDGDRRLFGARSGRSTCSCRRSPSRRVRTGSASTRSARAIPHRAWRRYVAGRNEDAGSRELDAPTAGPRRYRRRRRRRRHVLRLGRTVRSATGRSCSSTAACARR